MSWIGGKGRSPAELSMSLRLGPIDGKNVEQPASRKALRARQANLVIDCMLPDARLRAYVRYLCSMVASVPAGRAANIQRCARAHILWRSASKGVHELTHRRAQPG